MNGDPQNDTPAEEKPATPEKKEGEVKDAQGACESK